MLLAVAKDLLGVMEDARSNVLLFGCCPLGEFDRADLLMLRAALVYVSRASGSPSLASFTE